MPNEGGEPAGRNPIEDMQTAILHITQLLQRIAAPGQQNPEHTLEALSSNISEFVFDPENGIIFEKWFARYTDLFESDARHLDDAAKVRLLLRKLDTASHSRYLNYILPRLPKDVTFEDTVKTLKKIFGEQTSLFRRRFKCLQLSKSEGDDIITYGGRVNRACEDFDFAKLTIDQFKCLVFVTGLKASKHADIRTRLLTRMENEKTDAPVTLQNLIDEFQQLVNLKADTSLIEHPVSSKASVHAVSEKKGPSEGTKSSFKPEAKFPKTPCWQCGQMHFVKDCTYSSHLCKSCNRVGHKEGYCGCFTKSSSPPSGDNSKRKKGKKHTKNKYQTNIVHTVNHTGTLTRFISTTINGRRATLQLDSGSPISIISEQTWRKVGSPALKPSTCEALSASKDPLPLVGEFTCLVGVNDIIKPGLCRVTSVKGLNLFGSEWMDLFDMWTKPLSSFINQVNQTNSSSFSGKHFLMRFPEVFKDTLGHCRKAQVSLHLKPDARPVFRPKRPVPYNAIPLVDTELDRLQQLGIISPVEYSDWAAPIVAVRKPGGKIRICADYSTGLNSLLEAHNFPLPTPDDIFAKLAGSKVYSIIDLSDAYLQVEVDDASKRMLTINTHRGLFNFNRLAPGVKSAPGAFQQLMHTMIAGISGVEVFLDDFIIFSETAEQHYQTLCTLFNRLQEYGFRLKLEKCHFYQREIKYLGHIVNENGLRPDPEKTAAISTMPRPTDVSTLRSFLGAVNFYGKFIREMHQLRRPLDQLLKKDSKFSWSAECQKAFTDIKKVLQSDLLLTHYDPALEIIVAGDASNTGIGAVIMHRFPDGQVKAIAHASKTLSAAERNYGHIEKEALALVFAVTKFHRMLLGRRFKLQTDHQPLVKVFGSKKGVPIHTANRLKRWALTLLGYDFDIEFVSTNNFGYADVLSRLISNHEQPEEEFVIASLNVESDLECVLDSNMEHLPVTFTMVQKATSEDPSMQRLIKFINSGWPKSGKAIQDPALQSFFHRRESLSVVKGCVMMMERLVIPECFRKKLLKQLHRGHPGIERVKAIARSIVYWPNIDDDIGEYIRRCSSCANAQKSPPQAEPHPWQSTEGPWERIHVDYAGPINGFSYLVVVDSFSKWPEIFQTKSSTASTTINFLRESFARFGVPKVIVSDNGTQFTGYEFRSFCEKLGLIHFRTAPFHPQSNGQAERFVDTLKRSLWKIQEGEGLPASAALQTFLQVYRATPSNLLDGKSPSEILNGRKMRTTLDLLKPSTANPRRPIANKLCQTRSFVAGSSVNAKVHKSNTSWKWQSGVIIEAIGTVHYNVLLDAPSGRKQLIRSHIDQLRANDSGKQENNEIELPLCILLDDFGMEPHAPEEPDEDASFLSARELPDALDNGDEPEETLEELIQPGLSDCSTPLPRPKRNVKLPRRLQNYVLS